jgi:hypothetical protein
MEDEVVAECPDSPATHFRKREEEVAAKFHAASKDKIFEALELVLLKIEERGTLIDCTDIPRKTGVDEITLVAAMENRMTRFTFVKYEAYRDRIDPKLLFRVVLKKTE